MKKLAQLGSLVLLLLVVQAAYSVNLRYLQYSPVRYFTEQDWEFAKAAAREALNKQETGEAVSWSNPDSGNSGDLVVTGVSEKDGTTCKNLQIRNRAHGIDGQAVFQFCQQPDQTWKADEATSK